MLLEECYYLNAACTSEISGQPISCQELCEAEPGFATCVDEQVRTDPLEDFNLCPHVPKPVSTPEPTFEDGGIMHLFHYTATLWVAYPLTMDPVPEDAEFTSIWSPAFQSTFSEMFGLASVQLVVEKIEHRSYPIAFPGSQLPPGWATHTTFLTFEVRVREDQANSTREAIEEGLMGVRPKNLTTMEGTLSARANVAAPSHVAVVGLKIKLITGRVQAFPGITTTRLSTYAVTTTTRPPITLKLWAAWRVRCMAPIVFRWEVLELELWADRCPSEGGMHRILPTDEGDASGNIGAVSSGDATEDTYGRDNAFDGLEYGAGTSWASECKGCDAGVAYLGLASSSLDAPLSAACVTVLQPETPSGQCAHIVLEATEATNLTAATWYPRTEFEGFGQFHSACVRRSRLDFPSLNCGSIDDNCGGSVDLGSCPGTNDVCDFNQCRCGGRAEVADPEFANFQCGTHSDGCGGMLSFGNCSSEVACEDHLCIDDTPAATRWRLVCASGTAGRWWLKEVEFHIDGTCSNQYRSFERTLSSGTTDMEHPAYNAFDGDENTYWGSMCKSCAPGAAWVGVDFGRPVRVLCLNVMQSELGLSQCPQLILQYSDDGAFWIEHQRFGFGKHAVGAEAMLQQGRDADLDDVFMRPEERSASLWRLVCNVPLSVQWGVYELAFFDDWECGNNLRAGMKRIIHGIESIWPFENAFDGREHTLWKSKCGNCDAVDEDDLGDGPRTCMCDLGDAFLGIEFLAPVMVRCVKLMQLETDMGACPELQLQLKSGAEEGIWVQRELFEDVGGFAYLVPRRRPGEEDASEASPHLTAGVGIFSSIVAAAINLVG